MKRKITLLMAVIALVFAGTNFAKAQNPCYTSLNRICMDDAYAYHYTSTDISVADCYKISATGTATNITPYPWDIAITADFTGSRNGSFQMTVTNPQADGCNSGFVDYFVYSGTMSINNSGGVRSYSGSGTWISYCNGNVSSTGTWSASGPCGAGFQVAPKTDGANPAKSGKAGFSMKISPNPVRNFTNITYNLAKASSVNVTVYNMMQQPVKVLVSENQSSGAHSINWNGQSASGSRAPNGIYRVVAIIDGKVYSETMQVIQ
ncbi:MAG: FlgD immunoglobulin-like domain containing protein [Bacteroidota bacterium]